MSEDEVAALKRLAELVGDRDATLDPELEHDAAVVRLIRVRRRVGDGSIDSPQRVVTTYHSLEGPVVYEDDPDRPDDPRIELLREALREALREWKALVAAADDGARTSTDHARIKKLEKLLDPQWRPQ